MRKRLLVSSLLGLLIAPLLLFALTNFRLGTVTYTGSRGNSGIIQNAGTNSAVAGALLCNDSNANATTSSCTSVGFGFTQVSIGKSTSVCSTGSGAENFCTTAVTISPTQADTNYVAACSGTGATNFPNINQVAKATGSITVTIMNGTASQAAVSTWAELDCVAIHP
jgi:hypothetical protein